jgi:hypothetical protein
MVAPGGVELHKINILQFTLSRMRARVSPCNFHFNNTFSGQCSPHQGDFSCFVPHFGDFLDSHLYNAFLWCNFSWMAIPVGTALFALQGISPWI